VGARALCSPTDAEPIEIDQHDAGSSVRAKYQQRRPGLRHLQRRRGSVCRRLARDRELPLRQCAGGGAVPGAGRAAGRGGGEQGAAAGEEEAASAAEDRQERRGRREPADDPHRCRAQPPPPDERVPRRAPLAHAGVLRPPGMIDLTTRSGTPIASLWPCVSVLLSFDGIDLVFQVMAKECLLDENKTMALLPFEAFRDFSSCQLMPTSVA
jgi:hypothetical protein